MNESDTSLVSSYFENEFQLLRKYTLIVHDTSFSKANIFFTPDIKLKNIVSGNSSTASTYGFCDAGFATKETAKSQPGTCQFGKTLSLSKKLSKMVLSNPRR